MKAESTERVKVGSGGAVGQTCVAIEAYFAALAADGVELSSDDLKPQKEGALAALEQKLGKLPSDVRQFLAHGLRAMSGAIQDGDRFASIGFDWLDARQIIDNTLMMREIAADTISDPKDRHAQVMSAGIALTYSPPQIVVADGVYHFHFSNPVVKVADSFAEFLSAWLASGCFSSHSFDLLWPRVKKHVPLAIPPAKNRWVKAYKKQFPAL